MASSASRTRVTVRTGPNVSSVTAGESSGTSSRMTGEISRPRTESTEPISAFAPRCRASATCSLTTPACFASVIGPYVAPASDPGRIAETRWVSFATKSSYTAWCT